MSKYKALMSDGTLKDFSANDEAARDAETKAWNDDASNRKLRQIKQLRKIKLEQTDWMSNSDVTMPSYIKTWRQSLRDIPANFDTSKYDELLAHDDKGKYTHSIWTQPTE